MAIQQFLADRQVFTARDFAQVFPGSQTDRNLLSRAVRNGAVDHPRRGLYVSKAGRYAQVAADPFDVAVAVAPDAVFGFLSALQLHGVAHNLVAETQFYTEQQMLPFKYNGHAYTPLHLGKRLVAVQDLLTVSGHSYRVTTKEQTIVDCLTRPALAGGPENLLRSLSGLAYIDTAVLLRLAAGANLSTKARLGWVLDVKRADWYIADDIFDQLRDDLGGGPYYFWSASTPKDAFWVKRWRLYLPYQEQGMASWLNL